MVDLKDMFLKSRDYLINTPGNEIFRDLVNAPHKKAAALYGKIKSLRPSKKSKKVLRGAALGASGLFWFLLWAGAKVGADNKIVRGVKRGFQKLDDKFLDTKKEFPKTANLTGQLAYWVMLYTVTSTAVDKVQEFFDDEKPAPIEIVIENYDFENRKNEARIWDGFSDVKRIYGSGWPYILAPRGTARYHSAIDILGAEAQTEGEVVKVRESSKDKGIKNDKEKDKQNYVIIKKPNGKYACYLHLIDIKVKKGDEIKAKELLGRVHPRDIEGDAHTHYFVSNTMLKDGEKFQNWMDKNINIDETVSDIVSARPGLERELLFSPKYVFVAKYLRARNQRESIRTIITSNSFSDKDPNITKAVIEYEKSIGEFKPSANTEIKAGFITGGCSFDVFCKQMQPYEPALFGMKCFFEQFSEQTFWDNGKYTGAVGIQSYYPEKGMDKDAAVDLKGGVAFPGIKVDGVISESDKQVAYNAYINYLYANSYYRLWRDMNGNRLRDKVVMALLDLYYQNGDGAVGSGLKDLISDPNATEDEIFAKMSEYRTSGGNVDAGTVRRGSVRVAFCKGWINIADFLNMETGAHNSADLASSGFYKNSLSQAKNNKSLQLEPFFDEDYFKKIKNYESSLELKKQNYNGKDKKGNKKTIILVPVRSVVPAGALAEIEKTKSGMPLLEKDRLELIQDILDDEAVKIAPKIIKEDGHMTIKDAGASNVDAVAARKAFDSYKKAASTDNPFVPNFIEKLIEDKGLLASAEKHAKAALVADKDNEDALLVTSDIALERKEYKAVISMVKEILEKSSNPEIRSAALYNAAAAYEAQGIWFKALTNYGWAKTRGNDQVTSEKLEEMRLLSEETPHWLSRANLEKDEELKLDIISDVVYSDTAGNYSPKHISQGFKTIAEIYEERSEFEIAAENYKQAFNITKERDLVVRAIENYLRAENYKSASIYARELVVYNQYPDSEPKKQANAWWLIGQAREGLKEYGAAKANYEKANKINPIYREDVNRVTSLTGPEISIQEFKKLRKEKNWKAIIAREKYIETSGQVNRNRGILWNQVGVAYREIGDIDNAIRCFKKALILNPRMPATQKALDELRAKKKVTSSVKNGKKKLVADFDKSGNKINEKLPSHTLNLAQVFSEGRG